MTSRTRFILCFVAALALSVSVFAQDVPTFFIQRIVVTNAERVSPAVIIFESRLREGQTYTEEQLSEANDRIRRLPYLLDATFALQKGDARDQYVLAISVNETRPVFYLFDAVVFRKDTDLLIDSTNDLVLGGRYFVGSRGSIHFGFIARDPQGPVTSNYSAFQAGYTQYDLFGSRAFLTLAANQIVTIPGSNRPQPEIVVGIPLSPNQTATLSFIGDDFDGQRGTEKILDGRWSYNTSNHPFFPTRGVVASLGGVFAWRDGTRPVFRADPIPVHSRAFAAELSAKKYWELRRSNSIAAEVVGGFAKTDFEAGDERQGASEGYGRALLRLSHALKPDDANSQSRLELTLRTVSRNFRIEVRNEGVTELSVSWARRNAWGALRLGAGYAW